MNSPIVLIHGLWLTPRSWEGWKARFEQRGHEVLAPAWPGVQRLPPAQIRTVWPALRNTANRKKTVPLTAKQFHFRFTNTMNDADAEAAYQRYYVPGPGRVLFQAGLANFNPHAVTKVDFHKDHPPPLLVIANDKDHPVP